MYLKPKPISLHKIKLNKIENNSYKQYLKKSRVNNSSQFCLPILNKDHFLSREVKNNKAFFYPVLLVYGKENIYDEKVLLKLKRTNKINYELLLDECDILIKLNKPKERKNKKKK